MAWVDRDYDDAPLPVWQARLTGVATPAAERDERLREFTNDEKRALTRVAVLAALRGPEREGGR